MTQPIDAEAIKEQHRKDWDHAAPRWRKYDESMRDALEPLTRRLLELAGIRSGHRVLDIASGTGEPGLPAAQLVGRSGVVQLTDQSPEMLAVARDKARAQGLHNVDFLVCDAEKLQLEPDSFDAALCRGALGLMPEPVAVLRISHRALRPGARIAVSVVGRPQANPYFTLPYLIFRNYVSLPRYDPKAPGPLYLSDSDNLRTTLAEAGFRDVHVEPLEDVSHEFESGREYWDYSRGFTGVASVLAQIPTDEHDKIGEEIAAAAGGGDPEARVRFKGESLLAAGVK